MRLYLLGKMGFEPISSDNQKHSALTGKKKVAIGFFKAIPLATSPCDKLLFLRVVGFEPTYTPSIVVTESVRPLQASICHRKAAEPFAYTLMKNAATRQPYPFPLKALHHIASDCHQGAMLVPRSIRC